jgi:putative NADPH-quinone reductase
MNIYILLGHPEKDSFNGALADAYEKAALAKGHMVRRQNIGDLNFDPILRKSDSTPLRLEADLQAAQANILWANHWVIIYPIWWGSVPALLKGFIDKTLHSGFAFKYHTTGPLWDKLLKGRSGELITTADAPWWWIWWQYGDSDLKAMKGATLGFCGISPIKVHRINNMRFKTAAQRQAQLQQVAAWVK